MCDCGRTGNSLECQWTIVLISFSFSGLGGFSGFWAAVSCFRSTSFIFQMTLTQQSDSEQKPLLFESAPLSNQLIKVQSLKWLIKHWVCFVFIKKKRTTIICIVEVVFTTFKKNLIIFVFSGYLKLCFWCDETRTRRPVQSEGQSFYFLFFLFMAVVMKNCTEKENVYKEEVWESVWMEKCALEVLLCRKTFHKCGPFIIQRRRQGFLCLVLHLCCTFMSCFLHHNFRLFLLDWKLSALICH